MRVARRAGYAVAAWLGLSAVAIPWAIWQDRRSEWVTRRIVDRALAAGDDW